MTSFIALHTDVPSRSYTSSPAPLRTETPFGGFPPCDLPPLYQRRQASHAPQPLIQTSVSTPTPDIRLSSLDYPSPVSSLQPTPYYPTFHPPTAMCFTPPYTSHLSSSPTYITPSGFSSVVPIQSKPVLHAPIQSKPVLHTPIQSKPVLHTPIQSKPVLHAPIQSKPVVNAPIQLCFSPPPVDKSSDTTSPVSESRPLDFLMLPGCSERPEIGHEVDDAIAQLLSSSPAKTLKKKKKKTSLPPSSLPRPKKSSSTISSRQSSLRRRLLDLDPHFPSQDLLSFMDLHVSSILHEQQLCLRDGPNNGLPADYNNWLSQRYTEQLHLVLNSVEGSLQAMERQTRAQQDRPRPANRALNPKAIRRMESWFRGHPTNLYPTQAQAAEMAALGGITVQQLRKWFANKRHRSRKQREAPAAQFEDFISEVFIK